MTSNHPHLIKTQISFLSVAILSIIAITFSLNSSLEAASTTLVYSVDRSAVPQLNYYELTLIINVSDASTITVVDHADNPITYASGPGADEITVTTASNMVKVTLDGATNLENIGTFRKANLKDNYAWAYSHGFDDNLALDDARQIYLDRNIPVTYHMVSEEKWVSENPFWSGDFSPAEFNEIMDAGWEINNHSSNHEEKETEGQSNCFIGLTRADRKADVLKAQTQLNALINMSSRPDYIVLGYTIPCGYQAQNQDYPGVVREIRDNQENTLLFVEGASGELYMDASAPFDFDRNLARDGRIDGMNAQSAVITGTFDTLSTLSQQNNRPYWYTTYAHGTFDGWVGAGHNLPVLESTIDYLIDTYGANGTNEVWIAPSATVYSYLLVRDKSVVTQIQGPETTVTPAIPSTSTPQPSETATYTPTPTITPIPTVVGSGTPTTPTTKTDFIFLPFLVSDFSRNR